MSSHLAPLRGLSCEARVRRLPQEDLETKTEQLSGLLETPPETIITAVVRNKVRA